MNRSMTATIEPPIQSPPGRFIVSIFLTYALFMSVLLCSAIPVTNVVIAGPVPLVVLSGLAFWIFATAFGAMLSPRHIRIAPPVICAVGSLLLSSIICIVVVWGGANGAGSADPESLPPIMQLMSRFQQLTENSNHFWQVLLGHAVGGALFEEGCKFLLPAQLLLMGKIQSGRLAMICGALSGLMFGICESESFAAVAYTIHPTSAYNFMVRFLVMAPAHALWTSIVTGLVFVMWKSNPQRAGRSHPPVWTLPAAMMMGVLLHGLHNTLQTCFGPRSVASAFLVSLLFFYAIARAVWELDLRNAPGSIDANASARPSSWPGAQLFVVTMALVVSLSSLTLWPVYQAIVRRLRDTTPTAAAMIVITKDGSGTSPAAPTSSVAGSVDPKMAASALKSSVSIMPS
jgi:hypothetical protein